MYLHLMGASNDLATVTMTFVPNTCGDKTNALFKISYTLPGHMKIR